MLIAYVLVSFLLAALLTFAGVRKLSHRPEVVASYARVGVREERLNLLAFILFAGAAGLLAGVLSRPLGIATAACLVVYFLAAIAAHVRHRATANVAMPLLMLTFAAVALALRIAAG